MTLNYCYWKFLFIFLLGVIRIDETSVKTNEAKNIKGLRSFPNVLFNPSYSTVNRNMRYQPYRYNNKARSKVNDEVAYLPQIRVKHWQPFKHLKRNHKRKQNHLSHNIKKAHRRKIKRKFKPSINLAPFYHEIPRDVNRAIASREKYEPANPNPVLFYPFLIAPKFKSKMKPRNVSDEFDDYMFEDYEDITTLSGSTTEIAVKGFEQNDFKSPTFGNMGNVPPSIETSAEGNVHLPQQNIPNFRNGAISQQQPPAQFQTIYAEIPPAKLFPETKVINSSYSMNTIKNETTLAQYLQNKINEITSIHNRFGRRKTVFVMSVLLLLLLLVFILIAIMYYKRHKDRVKKTYPFKKKNHYSFLRNSRQRKKDLLKQIGRIKFDDFSADGQVKS